MRHYDNGSCTYGKGDAKLLIHTTQVYLRRRIACALNAIQRIANKWTKLTDSW